jgi:site-specific DNA-methyltransferase (adenine-specific)
VYVGDCREIIPRIPECAAGRVDLVFADPPFNWSRAYDQWDDNLPRDHYLQFTYRWLDLCRSALRPGGAFWINIPDDTAAEIVVHLKHRSRDGDQPALDLENWCIWHYRFGQNTSERFINSKVHALWFVKPGGTRTWNVEQILEPSDRATTYFDPRTRSKKDGMPPGMRTPMDVWYGKFWGRIQGNNFERRHGHDNQLPEVYLERVVRACSNEGDLVMDPFLGSGTTGVIAHALGRRFIGIEYSRANAESAVTRMKEGPVRLGQALGQSTAIFPARSCGPKARRRMGLDTA